MKEREKEEKGGGRAGWKEGRRDKQGPDKRRKEKKIPRDSRGLRERKKGGKETDKGGEIEKKEGRR